MEVKIAHLPKKMPKFFDTSVTVKPANLKIEDNQIILTSKDSEIKIKYSKITKIQRVSYYKLAKYIHLTSKKRLLLIFLFQELTFLIFL